jgi:hypothetical protein
MNIAPIRFKHWLYPPKSREWLRVSLAGREASDSTPVPVASELTQIRCQRGCTAYQSQTDLNLFLFGYQQQLVVQ